jgi:hypothetical protein
MGMSKALSGPLEPLHSSILLACSLALGQRQNARLHQKEKSPF